MPLLNYTTSIKTEKTITEIQRKLALAGASDILTSYDADGVLTALSFRIHSKFGIVMTFMLPANIDAVEAVLKKQRIPSKFRTREQAAKVAWRIIKDWIEAQLAIVETTMVDIEQAFLPYVQNSKGQTLYKVLSDNKFKQLALK